VLFRSIENVSQDSAAVWEHKYRQAMEHVRQSEGTRDSLREALLTNQSLKSRLEDLKHDYQVAQQEVEALSAKHTEELMDVAEKAGVTFEELTEKEFDRLYRDNRKMKKDLAILTERKIQARTRIEKIERERDSLMESNARLLQQSTEKDEVNAKSLASVLHLRSLMEEIKKENAMMEDEVKKANELAAAAQAANDAKERISEDFRMEKENTEQQLEASQTALDEAMERINELTNEIAESSGNQASLETELTNTKNRCDELTKELSSQQQEIQKLLDAKTHAERDAHEARERLTASGKDTGDNVFSMEELSTQVKFLKNRLACPVCHYRDKECIIMRCRHMHCKQCVEERIQKRTRMCPTCNNKFSEKDVEDIWLSG